MTRTTHIEVLRLRGGGPSEASGLRRAARRWLEAADLHPPGLPPSAVLLVRHVADPPAGQGARSVGGVRPDPGWERAVRGELDEAARRAERPVEGRLPSNAAAVCFSDRAEQNACLALDLAGRAAVGRWWWRKSLRSVPGRDVSGRIARVLEDVPRATPAVFAYLTAWERTGEVLRALSTPDVKHVLGVLGETHDVPVTGVPESVPNSHGGARSVPGGRSGTGSPTPDPNRRTESLVSPPWGPAIEAAIPSEAPTRVHAALVGVSLTLHHRPAAAGTAAFAGALAGWMRRPAAGLDRYPPGSDRSVPGGRRTAGLHSLEGRETPEGSEHPRADSAGPSSTERPGASRAVSPTRDPAPTLARPDVDFSGPASRIAPGSPGMREAASPSASRTGAYPDSEAPADGSEPTDGVEKAMADESFSRKRAPTDAPSAAHHGRRDAAGAASSSAAPSSRSGGASGEPSVESRVAGLKRCFSGDHTPAGSSGTAEHGEKRQIPDVQAGGPFVSESENWSTELGGILYLVNLIVRLELPEIFEDPDRLGSTAGPWGVLEALARALLGSDGRSHSEDGMWEALAHLDGRDPATPAGSAYRRTEVFACPPAWIEEVGRPAGPVRWHVSSGRLRMWTDRYLLADLSLENGEEPAAQATHFAPRYGIRPDRLQVSTTPDPWRTDRDLPGLAPALAWWAVRSVPFVSHRLRRALDLPPEVDLAGPLLEVPGVVHVSSMHVDWTAPLEAVSLAARLAGLDRDPGWTPSFARVILFHFD